MAAHPDHYTTWFRICFERAAEHWASEFRFPLPVSKGPSASGPAGHRAGVAGLLGFLHAVGLTGVAVYDANLVLDLTVFNCCSPPPSSSVSATV